MPNKRSISTHMLRAIAHSSGRQPNKKSRRVEESGERDEHLVHSKIVEGPRMVHEFNTRVLKVLTGPVVVSCAIRARRMVALLIDFPNLSANTILRLGKASSFVEPHVNLDGQWESVGRTASYQELGC